MGALGRIDPLIALWAPFLLFAGLILWMYHTLAFKPGGQPIGALERVFARIGKAFGRHRPAPRQANARRFVINLRFFPSRRIAFYMARLFVTRGLAVLIALVGILVILDLLGNSGDILEHPGNGDAELWRYVGLRIPQLIARFLPFAVLLGTLIMLASLNQHSEIISMKAAGISAHQIIAPLILAAALIAVLHFLFIERVVTRANAALDAWDGGRLRAGAGGRHGARQRSLRAWRRSLVRPARRRQWREYPPAGRADLRSRGRHAAAHPLGRARPPRAPAAAGRWKTQPCSTSTAASFARVGNVRFGADVRPDEFTLADVDPDQQNFARLRTTIGQLKAADRATEMLEANLWHKLAGPLSTMLMPLLAAVAAFGLARSGQLMVRAVIGMALGFAYFVADNFALAMGNLGAYPPFLAAWGPFLLFLLVGRSRADPDRGIGFERRGHRARRHPRRGCARGLACRALPCRGADRGAGAAALHLAVRDRDLRHLCRAVGRGEPDHQHRRPVDDERAAAGRADAGQRGARPRRGQAGAAGLGPSRNR